MIHRTPRPKRSFTVVSNQVICDDRLSFKATGVLIYILSKPDNWSTNTFQLAKAKREGADAIRSAIKELEVAGYVKRSRYQDKCGRWAFKVEVFDTPQLSTVCPPPHRENPHEENPHI